MKLWSLLGLVLSAAISFSVSAGTLEDRIKEGDTIRIGFANEVPWAYPGENNKPLGLTNAYVIGVLKKMGYTNIEPVVTEWGGMVPGLKAKRLDIITGGMYILGSRCRHINFSEPMGKFGDAFIVKKGNPKGINNYQDLKNKGLMLVTGAGYNSVEAAKREGLPNSKIMQVPGPTEIFAAVRSGRADAGAATYFTALNLAKKSGGTIEVTDPEDLPAWTLNYVGIAFRNSDADFLKRFNKAQAEFLGSEEMLSTVAEYGYTKAQLPGDITRKWACENR